MKLLMFNGPWQLLVSRAALKTAGIQALDPAEWRILLLGCADGTPIREIMLKICAQLYPGVPIVDLKDMSPWGWSRETFATLRRELPAGANQVTELWTGLPNSLLVGMLYLQYPKLKLLAYEEGLHTYTSSFGLRGPRPTPHLQRMVVSASTSFTEGSWPGPLKKIGSIGLEFSHKTPRPAVAAFYGILVDYVTPPHDPSVAIHKIDNAHVLQTFEEFRQALGRSPLHFSDPTVLLLGENFLWTVRNRYEDVIESYVQAIRALIDRGFTVLWKPHPRMMRFCSDYLKIKINSERFVWDREIDAMPAEIAFGGSNLHGVASMMSSCLFYFPHFFNLPSGLLPLPASFNSSIGNLDEVWDICRLKSEEFPKFLESISGADTVAPQGSVT